MNAHEHGREQRRPLIRRGLIDGLAFTDVEAETAAIAGPRVPSDLVVGKVLDDPLIVNRIVPRLSARGHLPL